jgi:hypothetical protein
LIILNNIRNEEKIKILISGQYKNKYYLINKNNEYSCEIGTTEIKFYKITNSINSPYTIYKFKFSLLNIKDDIFTQIQTRTKYFKKIQTFTPPE